MARHGENIYKRKDGRYEGRYVVGRDAQGRTRFGYIYGRQYTVVRQQLMQKKVELNSNRGAEPARGMTLERWMTCWLEDTMRLRLKPSSYQTYCRHFRHHIQPLLGCVELVRLCAADVRGLLAILYRKGFSPSTVRSTLRLLSAAMDGAQEDGLIRRNPCRKIILSQAAKPEQRVLAAGEQEQLRQASLAGGNLSALLGLYSGMRLGEICALQWQDVNWEKKTITVRRTVQRVSRMEQHVHSPRTMLLIGTPKTTRSCRVIPVPDFLLTLLRRQFEQSRSAFIFGTDNRAAEPRTVQRRFSAVVRRLGLHGVHFHTLRHTFATRLLELGVDVKTVSALLGHSSARITLDFYAHSLLEHQRQAIDRLAQIGI